VGVTLRPVVPADYARLAAVAAAIDPHETRGADWYRDRDANWNPRLERHRLVAERDGLVAGWGEVSQGWWAYHPRKFRLRLEVDPACQRQGVGSRLYAELTAHALTHWNPIQIAAEASELRPGSIAFLEHRGFVEAQRRWDATLDLQHARLERFVLAVARVTEQGIALVSLADERARRAEHFDQDVYDFERRVYLDEPGYDAEGSLQFDQFVDFELGPNSAIDAGSFLALDDERMVGISRLRRDSRGVRMLHVGFTGVDAAYRGRGIAVALKLLTVDFARRQGYAAIRTENDASNAPMLHINRSLGFELQPASIIFHKRYAPG
jgi:GNAT superfamily N-acetyltransferase